jgi:hypothetical protein
MNNSELLEWEERYQKMIYELKDSSEHKRYMLLNDDCFYEWVEEMKLIEERKKYA